MIKTSWDIEVGDRTFTVPRLPLKHSRKVYPLCQKLSNANLPERVRGKFNTDGSWTAPPPLQVTDDEMDDLVKVVMLACQAADPELTEEVFGEMPITPPQLYDAFFAIRIASGGWAVPEAEDQKKPGEGEGMAAPPALTSTASLEN